MTTDKDLRILIVEDNDSDFELVLRELRKAGLKFRYQRAKTKDEFEHAFAELCPNVIICDYRLPAFNAPSALAILKERCPEVPFIVLSGTIEDVVAVDILKNGAADYITKEHLLTLPAAVERALSQAKERAERKVAEEALRESEERYRIFYEYSRDAIMLLEPPDWRFTSANSAMVELFRAKDKSEFASKAPWELSPKHQPDGELSSVKARRMIDTAMEKGVNFFEWIHKRIDGEDFPATVLLARMEMKGQAFLQATVRDITELKKAGEALKESEERLSAIFQNAQEGILIADAETKKFIEANELMLKWLGYNAEEIRGMGVSDLHRPEDLAHALDCFEKLLKKEAVLVTDVLLKRKDGSVFYADIAAADVEIGGKYYIAGFFRDMTERKLTDKTLQTSEKRYRQLFEESGDAIFIADPKTRMLIDCNNEAEKLTGYSKSEILSMRATQLHPEELVEATMKGFSDQVAGVVNNIESEILKKDGKRIPVLINASIMELEGKPCLMGTFRDISERIAAEEFIRKEKELAQKYLDAAAVMMLVIGADGKVAMINEKGSEILGYPKEQLVGRDWFDNFLPERVRKEVRNVYHRIVHGEDGLFNYVENFVLTANGEERLIAWNNTALQDETGNIISTLSSGEDITERKAAEAELMDKIRDLERFHKVTIGREQRIIELKEEVKRLKERVGDG